MGRLAEIAGAKALKGKITVTDTTGNTRVFDSEAEAEEALGGPVFHYRGAFWQEGCEPRGWPEEKARREAAAAKAGKERSPKNPLTAIKAKPPQVVSEETPKVKRKRS